MGDFDEILDKKPFFEHHTNGKTIEIESQFSLGGDIFKPIGCQKISKQIYQFHHCKYKTNCPHNCKYLLFFDDFTTDNVILTDCSIFRAFYHLNLLEVSIFFKKGPMNY